MSFFTPSAASYAPIFHESSSILPTSPPNMEAFGRASQEIGDELVGPPPAIA